METSVTTDALNFHQIIFTKMIFTLTLSLHSKLIETYCNILHHMPN